MAFETTLQRARALTLALRRRLRGRPAEDVSPRRFFSNYYSCRWWPGKESRSGPGSEGAFGAQKVGILEELIEQRTIRSVLDVGCGDLHWMRELAPRLERYHGVDVVPALIRSNRRRYGSDTVSFQCLDLTDPRDQGELAPGPFDLVVCFDVVGHLLNEELERLLGFVMGGGVDARTCLLTSRRDDHSREFLQRPKSRHEGIDARVHPVIQRLGLAPVWEREALYEGDHFELYELPPGA